MEEIWKDVKGYEGLYQVSNFGKVKSVERVIIQRDGKIKKIRGAIKKQRLIKKGYATVCLCKNCKSKFFLVHRLVAIAFVDNPFEYPCVNHKDECKTNNNAENLEWCTCKYNSNYGTIKERIIDTRRKNNKQEDINNKIRETAKKKGLRTAERAINQFTWDGVFVKRFDSAEQVKKQLGIQSTGSCANGTQNHAGGFIWLYDEDVDRIKDRVLEQKPTKVVLQCSKHGNVIKKWKCPLEIHKVTGISLTALSNCLHGRAKSSGGYIWKYNN